jgi:putative DNA primase/helicase
MTEKPEPPKKRKKTTGGLARVRKAVAGAKVLSGPDAAASPAPPPADQADEGRDVTVLCAKEPETDIGNGRRFRLRNESTVLHVTNVGWHVYDGTRWAEDMGDRHIRPLVHKTAEAIQDEANYIELTEFEKNALEEMRRVKDEYGQLKSKGRQLEDDERARLNMLEAVMAEGAVAQKSLSARRSARKKFAKSSGGSAKLDNMLKEAAPYLSRQLREMDAKALDLNVMNGTLEFVSEDDPDNPDPDEERLAWSVRHRPHRREDQITKMMQVEYDPEAKAPLFENFLKEVQPSKASREFLQRYFGYCCTALTSEQVFVFFYGEGRNGKSTLVDLLAQIMSDYSTTVPFETLAGDDRRKGGEATPDLARLPGARLVRAAEPEQGMKFRESMIKTLTSGEPILIRRLHAEFTEIYPTFKLVISGNHKPDVRGTDDGIWRRVLLVPWDVQIPRENIDRRLPEKLWGERSGILNWLLQGVLDYLHHGLMVPESVRAATNEYREDSDPVGSFLEDRCEITKDDADRLSPQTLFTAFSLYCQEQGHTTWKATTFNRQLPPKAKKLGIKRYKSNGDRGYSGVKLNVS